jgi:hypothetical protein
MSMTGTLLADYDFAMTGYENAQERAGGDFSRNFWQKESLT